MIKRMLVMGLLVSFLSAATFAFAEDVYVTPNGKKYHTATCRLIKNKESMKKIDKKEAISAGYLPCGSCLKEEAKALKSNIEPEIQEQK